MPRKPTLARWERADARFRVTVFARTDHASFRVRHNYVGHPPITSAADTLDRAVQIAEGYWRAYETGVLEAPEVAPATFSELLEAVCERPKLAPKSRHGYRQTWTQFGRFVDMRAPNRISQIDVRAFLAGFGASTAARYLRELRAGFRHAIKSGWLRHDPTNEIKVEARHDLGPWLPFSEWGVYLAACSRGHAIRSGFVLETGLRAGEIAAARWDWIHGQVGRRAIRIAGDGTWSPKRGTTRAVPLTAEAERWLGEARARWGDVGFIFSSDGLSALGNLARETRAAVAASGCTHVDFHGLRRSAGAAWLEHGASLLEVSRLLGHSTVRVTERWYAGVSDRHLGDVMARVEAARAGVEAVPSIRSAKRSAKGS